MSSRGECPLARMGSAFSRCCGRPSSAPSNFPGVGDAFGALRDRRQKTSPPLLDRRPPAAVELAVSEPGIPRLVRNQRTEKRDSTGGTNDV